MSRTSKFITSVLALGFACTAQAALLVDSGEPTNEWPSLFVGGYGQAGFISQMLAGRFTLNGAHDIYAMQGFLAVNRQGLIEISILSDDAGRPGAPLFSQSFLSATDQFPYYYGWQGSTGFAGHLSAGSYWIAFGAPQGSTFEGGMGSSDLSAPVMQAEATRANMGGDLGWSNWFVTPLDAGPNVGLGVYARIYGNPVPIPAPAWLLGGGLAALVAMRRQSGGPQT